MGFTRRAGAALVAGAVLACVTTVTRADAAVNTVPVPAGGVTVFGKGFGHGKGMSQWGAYGAAVAGLHAGQILAFYYPGTRPGGLRNPLVRIRLTALDGGILTFGPVGANSVVSGLAVAGGNGRVLRLPVAARWRAVPVRGGFAVQRPAGRAWGTYTTLPAPLTFSGGVLRTEFGRRKGDCKNSYDALFSGSVRAVYYGNRAYYQAVQPMENYLTGVISSEMPATWPQQALRAQAIAARTYTAWAQSRGFFYDVRDDTGDQCWDGAAAVHPNTTVAVKATANAVSMYNGRPILAQFSSSNGGWSAPGQVPYLASRADPYEARGRSPHLAWSVVVPPARLAALDGPGGLVRPANVTVISRDGRGAWGGRVALIRIAGYTAAGPPTHFTISGDAFRRGVGLRSNYFGFAAG